MLTVNVLADGSRRRSDALVRETAFMLASADLGWTLRAIRRTMVSLLHRAGLSRSCPRI